MNIIEKYVFNNTISIGDRVRFKIDKYSDMSAENAIGKGFLELHEDERLTVTKIYEDNPNTFYVESDTLAGYINKTFLKKVNTK